MTRISKGSQEVIKWNTERLIRSVLNPNEGMRLLPPSRSIPLAYRYLTIGTLSLGLAMCSPVGNDPLPPLPLPYTEGYLTQFFPSFFNHKE
jgi:hypothetical protein